MRLKISLNFSVKTTTNSATEKTAFSPIKVMIMKFIESFIITLLTNIITTILIQNWLLL